MRTAIRCFVAAVLVIPGLCSLALAGDAKVELGRRLFMDPTVSRAARFSCADCHSPEHGFSDPRVLSEDENGKTARHSQPLLDLNDGAGMHWDGEFFKVRELLVARLAPNPDAVAQSVDLAARHFEAAKRRGGDSKAFEARTRALTPPPPVRASWVASPQAPITLAAPLTRRLQDEGRYRAGFRSVYGSEAVTTDRVIDAMEAYVLSLHSGTAPYDRYVAGDPAAISASARRGLALFKGEANCASCHTMDGDRARFTDDKFHNTGVAYADGVGKVKGRLDRSFVPADRASFKTPGLRDVARRAPFMHDGSLKTLKDVVRYYAQGGTPNPHQDKAVRPIALTDGELDDLVAFLETLSSDERPGFGPASRTRGRQTTVHVVDPDGRSLRGIEVRVVPFGDRLGRAPLSTRAAKRTRTDKFGRIRFRFPDWTHVRLESPVFALDEGAPIPDYVRARTVIAAPGSETFVRIASPSQLPKEIAANGRLGRTVFQRVRRLDGPYALYKAMRTVRGDDVVRFALPGLRSRRFAVRFGRGFTNALDFRDDPNIATARAAPPPPRSGAAEHNPRETPFEARRIR